MKSSSVKKNPADVPDSDAAKTFAVVIPDWNCLEPSDPFVGALVEIARTAGDLALGFFRPGAKTSAAISKKTGGSPVTEADHAVNAYLEQKLRRLLPDAGWLSEESADSNDRLDKDVVFVVDPIDGTRGFAMGELAWAVSIAVVYRQRPVIGIVHAPALAETYVGVAHGGAKLNGKAIAVSERKKLNPSALVAGPLSMASELRSVGLQFDLLPKISSLALRIAKVATGALDAGLISENSNDWDIAAADVILTEAGGRLTSLYGRDLLYNRASTQHTELLAGPQQILAQISGAIMQARGL
ncbi:MAG TPA: 3'(2'),5'-bisphosphate nucleotidase CysQ [Methylovirgula sp.]